MCGLMVGAPSVTCVSLRPPTDPRRARRLMNAVGTLYHGVSLTPGPEEAPTPNPLPRARWRGRRAACAARTPLDQNPQNPRIWLRSRWGCGYLVQRPGDL